jgi:hypothetical protein
VSTLRPVQTEASANRGPPANRGHCKPSPPSRKLRPPQQTEATRHAQVRRGPSALPCPAAPAADAPAPRAAPSRVAPRAGRPLRRPGPRRLSRPAKQRGPQRCAERATAATAPAPPRPVAPPALPLGRARRELRAPSAAAGRCRGARAASCSRRLLACWLPAGGTWRPAAAGGAGFGGATGRPFPRLPRSCNTDGRELLEGTRQRARALGACGPPGVGGAWLTHTRAAGQGGGGGGAGRGRAGRGLRATGYGLGLGLGFGRGVRAPARRALRRRARRSWWTAAWGVHRCAWDASHNDSIKGGTAHNLSGVGFCRKHWPEQAVPTRTPARQFRAAITAEREMCACRADIQDPAAPQV